MEHRTGSRCLQRSSGWKPAHCSVTFPSFSCCLLWIFLFAIDLKEEALEGPYGIRYYAVTGFIVEKLRSINPALFLLVFYGAEILHRERTVRVEGACIQHTGSRQDHLVGKSRYPAAVGDTAGNGEHCNRRCHSVVFRCCSFI